MPYLPGQKLFTPENIEATASAIVSADSENRREDPEVARARITLVESERKLAKHLDGLEAGIPAEVIAPRIAAAQREKAAAEEIAGLLPALSASTRSAVLTSANRTLGSGVTAAGRALQKHAARAGSWLANAGRGGNAAANAAAADRIILDVLEKGAVSTATHPVFGDVVRMRLADGAGIWFRNDGEFIGFLERYTSR